MAGKADLVNSITDGTASITVPDLPIHGAWLVPESYATLGFAPRIAGSTWDPGEAKSGAGDGGGG